MDRFLSSVDTVAPVDPFSEHGLLSGVSRELERASVGCARLIHTAQALKEVAAGRVVEVVPAERPGECVDLGEGGFWPGGVAPGDGAVELGEPTAPGGAACRRAARSVASRYRPSRQPRRGRRRSPPGAGRALAGGASPPSRAIERRRRWPRGPSSSDPDARAARGFVGVESRVGAGSVESNQCQQAGSLGLRWHQVMELGCQPFGVLDQIS